MNIENIKYNQYSLVKEMLETSNVIVHMDIDRISNYKINSENILLTGEGSSRIFPAKNLIYSVLKNHYPQHVITEGALQAKEYNLSHYHVFVASNSGKTSEGVRFIRHFKNNFSGSITGVVAHDHTPIADEANDYYLLSCGEENAVAATKSVMEQALFYDILFRKHNHQLLPDLNKLGDIILSTLQLEISQEIISILSQSAMIYFSGRNNGVAEELRLKTNEITRKKSDYLEGTYGVHGIEEVMNRDEVVVLIDPYEDEEEKFRKTLIEGVGIKIIAISSRDTSFPTIKIPSYKGFDPYIQLAAGWNLLVETGISSGINLDKPVRARKIGNEFTG